MGVTRLEKSTMALVNIFVVFSCVTYYAVVSTPVQRLCPSGQFLDELVGTCTPCSEICEHSGEQGTSAQCAHTCPDYKTEGKKTTDQPLDLCPPETYLDSTLRCEFCSDICEGEQTNDRCKRKCPGYVDKGPERVKLNMILWVAVTFLSVVLLLLITAIMFKVVSVKRQAVSRGTNYRKDAPFIVPYLKLDEEKPAQRVNQWLSLLHSTEGETDSRFGSKSSLIYTPPKTRI